MLYMYTVGMPDVHTIFGIKFCPFPTCYMCIHCSLLQHQKRATATMKYKVLSPQDMTKHKVNVVILCLSVKVCLSTVFIGPGAINQPSCPGNLTAV